MAKHKQSISLPIECIKSLDRISENLGRSKNWIVENAILVYANSILDYLNLDDEMRDYLIAKKGQWKDSMRSEMLKRKLSKGFMLKNSIRKIFEMVNFGVSKEYIFDTIKIYKSLCDSKEYVELLDVLKEELTNNKHPDINRLKDKLDELSRNELTVLEIR